MKYTKDNPPLQCYMRQSRWYKMAKTAKILGVCWHSTGANNPLIARYVQPDDDAPDRAKMLQILGTNRNRNDWNHLPDLKAGVHCFVGKLADGTVSTVNVGPWGLEAWGVGTGTTGYSMNQGWIQFEICEDSLKDPEYFAAVYREGVHLTAYLCKEFGLNPTGEVLFHGRFCPVITCHAESYNLGFGSNHGDVLHWFKRYGKTMEDVRDDVQALLNEPEPEPEKEEDNVKRYNTVQEIEEGFPWAAHIVQGLISAGILSGTDNGLDLSEDMLRLLVLIGRAGGLPEVMPKD